MRSYIETLIEKREQQNLSLEALSNQTGIAESTLESIEQTDDLLTLPYQVATLKSYLRKYGEAVELSERQIIAMLNHLDYLAYKASRQGKLKPFDYANRLVILILIIVIGYSFHGLYQQMQIDAQKESVTIIQPNANAEPNSVDQQAKKKALTHLS